MKKSASLLLLVSFFLPLKGFSLIIIDDYMTRNEKEATGVCNLKYQQFIALENWLNRNFCPKTCAEDSSSEENLYVEENLQGGSFLRLNNGTFYQVKPLDRITASGWLTAAPLHLGNSRDTNYPQIIVNLNTHTVVRVKEVSEEDNIPRTPQSSSSEPTMVTPSNPQTPPIEKAPAPIPPPVPPPTQASPAPEKETL